MAHMKAPGARILLSLAVLVLSGSAGAAEAEAGAVTLRLGVGAGDDAPMEGVAGAVVRSLNNAVPGVSFVLAKRPERAAGLSVWQSLQNGAVDAALVGMDEIAPLFDGLADLNAPFLFADADAAERFYTGGGGARIAELLGRRRVIAAGWIGTGAPYLLSRVPLDSAEAFRGLRVAVGTDSGVARELAALGADVVPLPGGQGFDEFFGGSCDAVEVADLSWIGGRRDDLAGVRLYATDTSFPYWALCISGAARAKVPAESWSALLDAAREGAAAGTDFSARSAFEAHALLLRRGGESNSLSLGRFVHAETDSSAPPGGESAGESAGIAPPDERAIPDSLDPVLKEELEEIIEVKNQSDFVG